MQIYQTLFTEGSWLTNDLIQFAQAVIFLLLCKSQKKVGEHISIDLGNGGAKRSKIRELYYCSGFMCELQY